MKTIADIASIIFALAIFLFMLWHVLNCRVYPADFIGPLKPCDQRGGYSPLAPMTP